MLYPLSYGGRPEEFGARKPGRRMSVLVAGGGTRQVHRAG